MYTVFRRCRQNHKQPMYVILYHHSNVLLKQNLRPLLSCLLAYITYSVYWDIRTPVIPDSWPVRTWIQLTDVFSYINVISIADSRHWHLRTRKSGENRLKMTQKWPKTTTKKTKLVKFFYRLFPLVTNRYHPTDCFELAMLPAGKYSHGKLWNSGEDFLGTYTRCH